MVLLLMSLALALFSLLLHSFCLILNMYLIFRVICCLSAKCLIGNALSSFHMVFVFFRTNYGVKQLGVLRLFPSSTILCTTTHLSCIVGWLLILNLLLIIIKSCFSTTSLVVLAFHICIVYFCLSFQIMTFSLVNSIC